MKPGAVINGCCFEPLSFGVLLDTAIGDHNKSTYPLYACQLILIK